MTEYGWTKGKRFFSANRGTKRGLAFDLLVVGDIKISKKDCITLGIQGSQEISGISQRMADTLLEGKGWKWIQREKLSR